MNDFLRKLGFHAHWVIDNYCLVPEENKKITSEAPEIKKVYKKLLCSIVTDECNVDYG